jgi:ribonucleotide monophosphatase NagD (HAD superfamily)
MSSTVTQMAPPFDLSRYEAAVFDLDGTVWLSEQPMPGAVAFVDRCRELEMTITFATNATALSVEHLTAALIACGLGRAGDSVVTGGSVVARSLAQRGVSDVVAEAPPAMRDTIAATGATVTTIEGTDLPTGWHEPAAHRALVLGASRMATFGAVERIGYLATLGHPLYATSLEPGFPALGRMEPGGGMLVAAARALYDVEPIVLAKPSEVYADAVRETVRADAPVVVFGDSQRADIGIAAHLGADGVLVSPSGRARDDLPSPHYITTGLDAEIRTYRREA